MTTAAHQLLDHLLDDLKKELFEKMHQNIVLELEKQKRNLQNMVAEMLTERKGEMLVVMMNKVHWEIMKEYLEHATYQVYCYLYKFKSETFQFFLALLDGKKASWIFAANHNT